MADPENYIPKINDPVVIGGSHDRFVVVGINTSKKTAEVRPVNSAIVLHNDVPWSKLFYLDGRERCADRENSH
jgi:hypothetical protein